MFTGKISYLSGTETREELSLQKGWRVGKILVCGIHGQEQRKKAFRVENKTTEDQVMDKHKVQ